MNISGCCSGGGFVITFSDIAGPYSGLLFGMSNTLGSSAGIVVPPFIAAVTENVVVVVVVVVVVICCSCYKQRMKCLMQLHYKQPKPSLLLQKKTCGIEKK